MSCSVKSKVSNDNKFVFHADQQLVTALLEDGYEGQELYNALSVVLPGLEPDAFNQFYDAWLEVQPWVSKKRQP